MPRYTTSTLLALPTRFPDDDASTEEPQLSDIESHTEIMTDNFNYNIRNFSNAAAILTFFDQERTLMIFP